jgi:hypothetical protein
LVPKKKQLFAGFTGFTVLPFITYRVWSLKVFWHFVQRGFMGRTFPTDQGLCERHSAFLERKKLLATHGESEERNITQILTKRLLILNLQPFEP